MTALKHHVGINSLSGKVSAFEAYIKSGDFLYALFRIILRMPRKLQQGGDTMAIANIISYILVLLGALNWGMFGLFDFNLVSAIFMGPRSVGSVIVYVLIALAALWLIISPIITNGALKLRGDRKIKSENNA